MNKKRSDIKKREMLFGDFFFHRGANVTVRKGVRWHTIEGVHIAKPTDENDKRKKKIVILDTEIYRFRELPARVIDKEHDGRARTYLGLLEGMREAYGDDFNEDEYVTVVYFVEVLGVKNEESNARKGIR